MYLKKMDMEVEVAENVKPPHSQRKETLPLTDASGAGARPRVGEWLFKSISLAVKGQGYC